MAKKGQQQRKYSAEFKIGVIMDMREHRLGYCETVRKYWDLTQGQAENYKNIVKRWERIFLEEGAEGVIQEAGFVKRSKTYGRTFAPALTREEYFAKSILSHTHKPRIIGLIQALLENSDVSMQDLEQMEKLLQERKSRI